jgi:hypothetical protein
MFPALLRLLAFPRRNDGTRHILMCWQLGLATLFLTPCRQRDATLERIPDSRNKLSGLNLQLRCLKGARHYFDLLDSSDLASVRHGFQFFEAPR